MPPPPRRPVPCRRSRRFIMWRASIKGARGGDGDVRAFRPVDCRARGSGRTHSLWGGLAPYLRTPHRRAPARARRPPPAYCRAGCRHAAAEPGHARRCARPCPAGLFAAAGRIAARGRARYARSGAHAPIGSARRCGRLRRSQWRSRRRGGATSSRREIRRGDGLGRGAGVLRHRPAGAGRPQAPAIQLGARSPAGTRARHGHGAEEP